MNDALSRILLYDADFIEDDWLLAIAQQLQSANTTIDLARLP